MLAGTDLWDSHMIYGNNKLLYKSKEGEYVLKDCLEVFKRQNANR